MAETRVPLGFFKPNPGATPEENKATFVSAALGMLKQAREHNARVRGEQPVIDPAVPLPETKPPTSRVELPPMRPEPGETKEAFTVRATEEVRQAVKGAKARAKPKGPAATGAPRDPSDGGEPRTSDEPEPAEEKSAKTDLPKKFEEYAGNKPEPPPT